jgi:hypothetical protein
MHVKMTRVSERLACLDMYSNSIYRREFNRVDSLRLKLFAEAYHHVADKFRLELQD